MRTALDIPAGSIGVGLRPFAIPTDCVSLTTPHGGFSPGRAAEVTVDRVLSVTCLAPFDIAQVVVEVKGPGEEVRFTDTLSLNYSFVP